MPVSMRTLAQARDAARLVECLPCITKPWVWSSALHKPSLFVYTCILALGRERQEDQKFKARLGYIGEISTNPAPPNPRVDAKGWLITSFKIIVQNQEADIGMVHPYPGLSSFPCTCLRVYSSELFYPCTDSGHIRVIQNQPITSRATMGFLSSTPGNSSLVLHLIVSCHF